MRVNCRECLKKAAISHFEKISPERTKLYCQCLDPRCGFGFVSEVNFSHTVRPSAISNESSLPDQLLQLPAVSRTEMLEQLDMLR